MKKSKRVAALAASLVLLLGTASVAAACNSHVHELDHVRAQQSFCLKDGNIEYWECETCGKIFADEAATQEIAKEDTIIPAAHKPEYIPAETSDDVFTCTGIAHYKCTVCEGLFSDEACTQSLTLEDIYTPKTFTLTDTSVVKDDGVSQTSRIYANADGENLELAVTETNFAMRLFLGWKTEGSVFDSAATDGKQYRLNLNIDTQENIAAGKWHAFRYGCDSAGLFYEFTGEGGQKYFSTLTGGSALTEAFKKQNGLYITVVRAGGLVTVYAENLEGNRILIGTSKQFTASAMVKATLGVHASYVSSEACSAIAKEGVLVIGTTDPAAPKSAANA